MLKKIFLPLLLMLLSLNGQEKTQLFQEANNAFERANEMALRNPAKAESAYREAALKYQFLIDSNSARTSDLYTNLANTHFFLGDHGRAIINYHKALILDPLNNDARHNLDYLRTLVTDKLPEVSLTQRLLSDLIFWKRWPLTLNITIFALASVILWGILSRRLFNKKANDHWIICACIVIIGLLGTTSFMTSFHIGAQVDGVVTAKKTQALQGNGFIYEDAFSSDLHNGTEFRLLEKRNHWLHVELLDGSRCWLTIQSSELIRSEI